LPQGTVGRELVEEGRSPTSETGRLVAVGGVNQLFAGRKPPIQGGDPDARVLRDPLQGGRSLIPGERGCGGGVQFVFVGPRVGPDRSNRWISHAVPHAG
ncbi:MAG: hypothetical protein QOE20_5559, partial [Mycobacterium sp.]|nr:hypothetical protein [Mycobacterium sp.]